MSYKQKSGFKKRKEAEAKARSDLSNRPGQLKISNWFKEPPVIDKDCDFNLSNLNEIDPTENCMVESNTFKDQETTTHPVDRYEPVELLTVNVPAALVSVDVAGSAEDKFQNPNYEIIDDSVDRSEATINVPGELLPVDVAGSSEVGFQNPNDEIIDDSVDRSEATINVPGELLPVDVAGSSEVGFQNPNDERCSLKIIAKQKLSVNLLIKNFDCLEMFKKVASGRQRPFICCKVCNEFENVAKKFSQNQQVPIANGIKVDSQEKLQRVVEHLEGNPHQQAVLAKKNHELWKARSERHDWRKYMNAGMDYLVQDLIRMAIDVYNDALHGTLPCFNWASRSLAYKRSEQLVIYTSENGFDADLPTFHPTDKILRHRNPSGYNEMLEIISDLEMDKFIQRINNCICYSIQVDGSLDRTLSDNKFTSLRLMESDGTMQSLFLSVTAPTKNGAQGLLEAVITAIKKLNREKLASLTTDGESANSGRDEGLWKLLEIELGRKILAVWCTCHRSDLALEDMEDQVLALTLWKSNAVACSTFFRTSKCRTKLLHECGQNLGIDVLAFPKNNEIRFAEHGEGLLKAIIRNLPACRKVWTTIFESQDYSYPSKEKLKASNLLNTWTHDSLQYKLTAFMRDVYNVFTSLQKGLQRSHIIMPDVLTLRDAAIRKFDVILRGPFPGGDEEKALKIILEKNSTIRSHFPSLTNKTCDYQKIRDKVAELSKNFLSRRLNIEQEESIVLMKNILTSTTCATLIKHSVDALKLFVNSEDQDKFSTLANDICEQWPIIKDIPHIDTSDVGSKYSVRLRQMFVKSRGQFQWLLGAFAVTSPHSMGTERVVSHFNKNKSIHQENFELSHVSQRLNISLNCVGTAYFDPRPAVVAFLEKKDRRFRHADIEIYKTHDFTKKFFRKETTV